MRKKEQRNRDWTRMLQCHLAICEQVERRSEELDQMPDDEQDVTAKSCLRHSNNHSPQQ